MSTKSLSDLPAYAEGAQQRFIMDWYNRVGPGNPIPSIGSLRALLDLSSDRDDAGNCASCTNASASANDDADTDKSARLDDCQCEGRRKRSLPCREDCPKRLNP